MITVACVYYEAHDGVPSWARCYSPEWVDKLYRGVARNYSKPFRFVCLADNLYNFKESIEIQSLDTTNWCTACLQLHAIEADRLVQIGLDSVITGSLDELFAYEGALAVPRDPYRPQHACNGVVLEPTRKDIALITNSSDMHALDLFPHDWIDDLYPKQVVSYKAHVMEHGVGGARIVYFHGVPKPHMLEEQWIKECWI
jgi:hypothetical protein